METPPTLGALARVRVVVSRSVITYSAPSAPLAGTSRFRRTAAYTRCLRCAGAPRRPANGSGLSLHIPSWHAVLFDPGESDHRLFQSSDVGIAFAEFSAARHSHDSAIRFTRGLIFRGFMVRISLRPTKLLAPLHGSDRALPSQRELLPPGFQRDKCPLLDMTTTVTGLLCWRDFHPQEWQLASLHENLIKLQRRSWRPTRMSCHSATANRVRLVSTLCVLADARRPRRDPRTSPLAAPSSRRSESA